MTDNSPWQPPAEFGASGPVAPSAFGDSPTAPPPPGTGYQQAPVGWTPPPKPGLIPLRPLTLGALLGASFQVLRRNPRPIFGFALLITGSVYFLTIVLVGLVTFAAFSRVASATGSDVGAVSAGATALVILAGLVGIALTIVASALLQGIVSLEVARGTLGEKLRLGGLWRAARGRVGALVGWTVLVAAAVMVAILIITVVIVLLATLGGVAGAIIAVLLGLVGLAAALVLGFWLSTRLSLVPSALMIERLPLRAAISRSWSLTTGFFWKTLGIELLVAMIISFATSIVTTPLQLVVTYGSLLINPNGDETASLVGVLVAYILAVVLSVVFGAIGSVMQSATAALIYVDLRMRKEGLDLELAHFVEARQAGDTSVVDPYLPRQAAPAAP